MPDLHEWIIGQIGEIETAARHAPKCLGRPVQIAPRPQFGECGCGGDTAALRHCAAIRLLLADLLAEKHTVCEDSWYHCVAADDNGDRDCNQPCGCGRDERVERRMRLLAEGYGLTPEILATLDQSEMPARPEPRPPVDLKAWVTSMTVAPAPIVPPALRGPNWKGAPDA